MALCYDVLVAIFDSSCGILSTKDLASCREVCRPWRDAVDGSNEFHARSAFRRANGAWHCPLTKHEEFVECCRHGEHRAAKWILETERRRGAWDGVHCRWSIDSTLGTLLAQGDEKSNAVADLLISAFPSHRFSAPDVLKKSALEGGTEAFDRYSTRIGFDRTRRSHDRALLVKWAMQSEHPRILEKIPASFRTVDSIAAWDFWALRKAHQQGRRASVAWAAEILRTSEDDMWRWVRESLGARAERDELLRARISVESEFRCVPGIGELVAPFPDS